MFGLNCLYIKDNASEYGGGWVEVGWRLLAAFSSHLSSRAFRLRV